MEFYQPDHRTIVKEIDFWPVVEIFDDFILGRNFKHTIHDLRYGYYLLYHPFIDRLRTYQYQPSQIKDVNIDYGKKMPAFYIKNTYAIFGFIFYTNIINQNPKKIFGSALRHENGLWKYVLSEDSKTIIFINPNKQENMLDTLGLI